MGRQINFYAGPQDIEALAKELRGKGAAIIAGQSPRAEPVVHDKDLPMFDGAVDAWLVRPQDLSKIRWGHYPKPEHWSLDQMTSPVVRLSGRTPRNHVMSKGRLWYSPEQSIRCKKPQDFLRWAESLLRIPPKLFSKLPKPEGYSYSVYIGPEAAELVASGNMVLDDPNFMPKAAGR